MAGKAGNKLGCTQIDAVKVSVVKLNVGAPKSQFHLISYVMTPQESSWRMKTIPKPKLYSPSNTRLNFVKKTNKILL